MTAMPGADDLRPGAPSPSFERALATERRYFELGAVLTALDGAVLAAMPGLGGLPGGAVIHWVDPAAIIAGGERWIETAERSFAGAGAGLARIYLDHRGTPADDLLRRAGYRDRDEIAFVDPLPRGESPVALRAVESDSDWARKLELHRHAGESPDGHGNDAAHWVELERRKCAEGMEALLAEVGGEAIGAVCALWEDGMLRIKNLLVHPGHRRRSVGLGILTAMAALGRARGARDQCVFAVRGEAGEKLYRAAGLTIAGVQVEWSKPIGTGGR